MKVAASTVRVYFTNSPTFQRQTQLPSTRLLHGNMASGSSLSSESFENVVTSSISEKCSSDDGEPTMPHHHHKTQVPIAIVGMGCRLPGHSTSPTALWDLLERGGVAKNEPPPSRFSLAGHYDKANPGRPRTMKSPGGMFIEDMDPALFDGQFFNISRTECIAMDPQQRQMLEVAYECLENSGTPIETLSGTNAGVIVGTNFIGMDCSYVSKPNLLMSTQRLWCHSASRPGE